MTTAGLLTIGALARASGVSAETIRTWERRYGYPVAQRSSSGHRFYPISSIARLRRVAEALTHGHRAAQVVAASDDDLDVLLQTSREPRSATSSFALLERIPTAELFAAVEHFDTRVLTRLLTAEWARRGPIAFVRDTVAPLLQQAGDAWEAGRLAVRHEHFLAERVGDLLRSFRLPFEERARGPLVVCATLSGEMHGLGLEMAALVLATVGCRVCYLGIDVPVPELARLAGELRARTVAVSVSVASAGRSATSRLQRLRTLLPRRATLLVGGSGAPPARPGIEVVTDFRVLHEWGTRLAREAA